MESYGSIKAEAVRVGTGLGRMGSWITSPSAGAGESCYHRCLLSWPSASRAGGCVNVHLLTGMTTSSTLLCRPAIPQEWKTSAYHSPCIVSKRREFAPRSGLYFPEAL